MDGRKYAALLLFLAILAGTAAAQSRMNTTTDQIELGLGERRQSTLLLHNPLDRPDTYDLKVETVMDEGAVVVRIDGDEATGDQVTVAVGAGETRAVTTHYRGAACPAEVCTGTATFVGRSLETDERFTAATQLALQRDTEVYGAPGIGRLHLVALGLLGAAASLLWT